MGLVSILDLSSSTVSHVSCFRQMSKWLARPRIIDYTGCAFGLPKLKIDESNVAPGLPSMFAHVMYQGQLVRILDKDVQPIGSVYTADQIHSIQRKIGQWMADFPAPYQVEKPDTQFDHDYPYVPSQRYQLHAIGFMLQLDPCRSYLTRYVDVSNDTLTAEFRAAGIDKCLNITKAARSMYEWEQETNAKAHLFAFALFDTATILCSAVLHDKDNTLTRREEVLGAIKTSLETLELVGKKTKLGAISYGFLAKLVNTLKIFDGVVPASATPGPDGPSAKRAKTDSSSGNEQHSSIDSNGSGEGAFVMVDRIVNEQQLQDVIFTSLTPQDWQGTVERGMTATNFNTYIDSMDMAELEQVWNWDTQNFDVPDGLI